MLKLLRRLTLTQWILVAMAIGIVLGGLFPDRNCPTNAGCFSAGDLKPLSTIFLRMIKSIVVPIIFATLVIGIAGHGDDMKRVGRLALKSIIYFEIVTTLALFIGLAAVNLTRPGVGVSLSAPAEQGEELARTGNDLTISSFLEHVVPQNVVEAAVHNEVLQVVFWAILFGVALSQVRGRPKEMMLGFCEGLSEVMFKFTALIMRYAPIGIGAAIAVTVAHSGFGILINLGKLILTLYAALIVFVVLVLVPVALLARVPIRRFLQAVKQPALIAFSTTSSEAALPRAMQAMEAIGVPRRIVAFVMPTGYSFNLDGTTLYLALASVFVAQAAGIELSTGEQLVMMLTLMLTSKGVAGVPRASLVILSGTLATFGLPLEGVAVILGVDELMDMGRTTINVVGNCLATVVMARWEGDFDPHAPVVPPEESPQALGVEQEPGVGRVPDHRPVT
ncbi:MAG TPA: cation:dicarboxylase symporter family transporter [Longimicrobiaceae bacterium]|nr:cation:dicarboxylase symporter family transporter [Longimicrobiaceae bacterium]